MYQFFYGVATHFKEILETTEPKQKETDGELKKGVKIHMAKNMSPWGKKCKISMFESGKTLEDISKDTGLSRTYISAIINGRVIVPDETVRKISVILNVNENLYKQEV